MYNLVLDFRIFKHFVINRPKDILQGGSLDENNFWNSFFSFIKKDANVEIINFEQNGEIGNIILNYLTTGRGISNIKLNEKKINVHNFKLTNKYIHTIFFLYEEDEKNQLKYRNNNGFVFGFLNDYTKIWKELSLVNENKTIPVRANINGSLKAWEDLHKQFNQITDVVIIDAFIFEGNLIEYNIIRILEIINQKSVGTWNLTIISSQAKNSTNELKNIFIELQILIAQKKINCRVKVVFSEKKLKEHDRQLIVNNIRFNSGDSFNYFNSKGDIITKGTEMHLLPLVDFSNLELTNIILNTAKKIEIETPCENIFGDCNNRFLN